MLSNSRKLLLKLFLCNQLWFTSLKFRRQYYNSNNEIALNDENSLSPSHLIL
uniref:Bm14470 n=1 Tax=Brugia malayi TaxID=6279 RepID=A0A0J9XY21_BRUMA|nr:Bm14470 [Brugia malayi]